MKKKLFFMVILSILFVLPITVNALTEKEIKEKKEVTVKSVPPKNEMQFYQMDEKFYEDTGFNLNNCNATFTKCTVTKGNGENNEVATGVIVKYEYDSDVKKVVDGIMAKVPEGGKTFYVDDIYALKWILEDNEYYLAHEDEEEMPEGISPIKYSTEYNNFISYNNFVFEPRMGYDSLFASYQAGTARFDYNGTTYGYADGLGVRVDHVLYVDDNETDIIGALKKRLSKYFDIDNITMESEYTLMDIIDDELNYCRDTYNACVTDKTEVDGLKEQYNTVKGEFDTLKAEIETLEAIPAENRTEEDNNNLASKNEQLSQKEYDVTIAQQNYENAQSNLENTCGILEEYTSADAYAKARKTEMLDVNNLDSEYSLFTKALPNLYVITIKNNDLAGLGFLVIKDSSKIVDDDFEVTSRDAKSGVTISNSGTNNVIPLDTLIEVSKITSGDDYNKIVKALEAVLDKDNMEMFDLKLFSKSASNYITKLENGKFEVRIPLSDKFKDKSLIAYYVDDKNNIKEYTVTVKSIDGVLYGVFTTDHFSVYTLSTKEEEKEPVFKLTYDFNGGSRQGEKEFVDESVGFGMDITKANFIDKLDVTAPEGKEIEAIEINGTKTEFGEVYILNKDTTFKYIWKDVTKEETVPDENEEKVPQTYDNITNYIIMFIASTIILTTTIYISKKKFIK